MPAAFAFASLSSAAAFVGIDAKTTVKALLPGGQPLGAGAGAGVVAVSVAGAGVVGEVVGAGVACEVVGGVSAGALGGGAAAGWVAGAAAVVLRASLVTAASAIATPMPASRRTIPTIAAGSRQLGGRW